MKRNHMVEIHRAPERPSLHWMSLLPSDYCLKTTSLSVLLRKVKPLKELISNF